MNKLTRVITFILIICFSTVQFIYADETAPSTFSDLNKDHWAYESIQKMTDAKIINGYPDNTFRPDAYINRAELIKLTNLVFSYTQKLDDTNLIDINATDWFYDHVLIAQKSGYIIGYEDLTFRANNFITRQELCKILDSINSFVELPNYKSPSDEVSTWAVEYVNRVVSNRIMLLDENNNFRATQFATRAEVCEALAKFVLDEKPIDKENTSSDKDKPVLTQKELYETIDRVIFELSTDVINNLETREQKEIINDIINNMSLYKADNSHDYLKAADEAYKKYKMLGVEEQEALKYEVQIRNATVDLLDLQEFFFPDLEI